MLKHMDLEAILESETEVLKGSLQNTIEAIVLNDLASKFETIENRSRSADVDSIIEDLNDIEQIDSITLKDINLHRIVKIYPRPQVVPHPGMIPSDSINLPISQTSEAEPPVLSVDSLF